MRKKLLWLLAGVLFVGFSPATSNLTDKERSFALDHLKSTKKSVILAVKGLTEEQWRFRPSPESWSIAECVEHIAGSEKELWTRVGSTLNTEANPGARNKIEMTDEQLVRQMQNRNQKLETIALPEPKAIVYHSKKEALEDFIHDRDALIAYMKNSEDNLRNHVGKTPAGWIDTYQMILLISSHTHRHAQQMREIKADSRFPKN